MNIVSPFKDYYDSALALGHDGGRRFLRLQKTIEYPRPKFYSGQQRHPLLEALSLAPAINNEYSVGNEHYRLCVYLLCFYGKFYAIWLDSTYVEYAKAMYKPEEVDLMIQNSTRSYTMCESAFEYSLPSKRFKSAVTFQNFLDENQQLGKIRDELAREVGAPYYLVNIHQSGLWRIQVNPRLQDLQFFKILAPYECFQEIDMCLGMMGEQDLMPITTGEDAILLKQKGFDEMSFRTHSPGKKKENRRNNRLRKRNSSI